MAKCSGGLAAHGSYRRRRRTHNRWRSHSKAPLGSRGTAGAPSWNRRDRVTKQWRSVYVVPTVRINEAITLDFIVDSGASDVLIPADVAMTLARTGTIAPGDFIGDREYRVADGSTLKSERFILRELKVGNRVLSNVVASIGSVKGEPLLGQEIFSPASGLGLIDNDRHLLALWGGPVSNSYRHSLGSRDAPDSQLPTR